MVAVVVVVKTMMGANAVPRARKRYGSSPKWQDRLTDLGFSRQLIDTYLHSRYVLVDMQYLSSFGGLEASLASLLYDSLREELKLPNTEPPQNWRVTRVVDYFLGLENEQRKKRANDAGESEYVPAAFFLQWDEVCCLLLLQFHLALPCSQRWVVHLIPCAMPVLWGGGDCWAQTLAGGGDRGSNVLSTIQLVSS